MCPWLSTSGRVWTCCLVSMARYWGREMQLRFVVPGNPVPKARPRLGQYCVYTPRTTHRYEVEVRRCAYNALANMKAWDKDAIYAVMLRVFWQDKRRRDIDNQAKAILDALNGVVWKDDFQVDRLTIERGFDKNSPRVEVDIEARPRPY